MKITNDTGLPDGVYRAILNDTYPSHPDWDISTTRLISPPQIVALQRKHWDDLVEDASDRIWSLVGQVGHGILERAELTALAEIRLYMREEGWTISGQLDRLTIDETGEVADYKFTSIYAATKPKPEWEAQLNVNAELAERNGQPVTGLKIVAIFRDWSKRQARIGKHPRRQVQVVTVPLWSREERVAYIRERVRLHQKAREGDIPECTPEERWEKPTTWAVMKEGRKTAVRVLDTPEAAEKVLGAERERGHKVTVVERPGEAVRCLDYCNVADFCPQWSKQNEETHPEEAEPVSVP